MDVFRVRVQATEKYLKYLEESFLPNWWVHRTNWIKADDWLGRLALIHPDHFFDIEHLRDSCPVRGVRKFPIEPGMSDKECGCKDVWGYSCPIHSGGQAIAADHLFPFSFGGPTLASNKLYLCSRHNLMKGSDLHCFPWELGEPRWLSALLERAASLKADRW